MRTSKRGNGQIRLSNCQGQLLQRHWTLDLQFESLLSMPEQDLFPVGDWVLQTVLCFLQLGH